jgi:hypothetical protein
MTYVSCLYISGRSRLFQVLISDPLKVHLDTTLSPCIPTSFTVILIFHILLVFFVLLILLIVKFAGHNREMQMFPVL